ncbi:MAG: cytochrome c [Salaquimonas sp.]
MTPKIIALILWLVTVIFAAIVWWMLPTEHNSTSNLLQTDNHSIVSLGKELYGIQCASCHGVNLEGQEDWQTRDTEGFLPAPPHNENGHTWHHPDEVLFKITKFGVAKAANLENYRSNMPAYEKVISDEEIIAVLSYLKSQWPKEIRIKHDEMNERYSVDSKK